MGLVETFLPSYEDPRLDRDFFEKLLGEMERRLTKLELLRVGLEGVLADASKLAVQRMDEYLKPRIDVVNQQLSEIKQLYDAMVAAVDQTSSTALAQIETQINAAFASVNAALSSVNTAIANANAAAEAANAAAAGVGASVAAALAGGAIVVTADRAAAAGERLYVDTSSGPVVITLPADPVAGQIVTLWRSGASAVTVARNGKTIAGLAEDLVLDVNLRGVRLTYLFGGWQAFPEVLA